MRSDFTETSKKHQKPDIGDVLYPHRGLYVSYLCESEDDALELIKIGLRFIGECRTAYLSGMAWLILSRVGIWCAFRIPTKESELSQQTLEGLKDRFSSHWSVTGKKPLATLEGTRLDTLGLSPLRPYLEVDLNTKYTRYLPSMELADIDEILLRGTTIHYD